MSDEERNSQARLGKILSAVGSIWILLFFVANFFDVGGTALGDILGFFGNSFFIPIALLFAGRVVRRRSGQLPGRTTVPTQQRPPQREATQRRPVAKPAPKAVSKPAPSPSPVEPDVEELAVAIGFEEETPEPEPDRGRDVREDQFKARYEPSYKAKSSDEMIAEARKRLKKKS